MDYAKLKVLYQAGAASVSRTNDGFTVTRSKYDRDTGEVERTITVELSYEDLEKDIDRTQDRLTAMNQLKGLLDNLEIT